MVSIMANYWADVGHDIHIITLSAKDALSVYPLHNSISLVNLDLAEDSPSISDKLLNNIKRIRFVRKALLSIAPDIALSFMDTMNVSTLLAVQGTGIPVIVSEHCHPVQFPIAQGWKQLRQIMYRKAGAVIVLGEDIRQWFADNIATRRLEILFNPVLPCPDTGPRSETTQRIIVAVGRLAEEKQFDKLIQAFAIVASAHAQWSLNIFGEGPDRRVLETLIHDLKMEERIFLRGWVPNISKELKKSDIFAMSSRSEAFPAALCEAMACGLPAVSFDCPSGPAEIIREKIDGILVPPNDVKGLAAGMKNLMTDPKMRREFGLKAAEVADRLSIEATMNRWGKLIEEIRG